MIIMGIDPGVARAGWAFITVEGSKIHVLKYGCIETHPGTSPEKRLVMLFHEITELIREHKPDAIGMEDLFFATNAKTAISVGQARGVLMLSAALENIPISSYSPLSIKLSVCGDGKAEKSQIGKMVVRLLKLPTIPKPDDTCDALAIAMTHAWSYKMNSVHDGNSL